MVSDFMKGRYNLMIYVGIDIAKLNHFASAISSDAKHPITSFFFILLLYTYIIMSLLIVIH